MKIWLAGYMGLDVSIVCWHVKVWLPGFSVYSLQIVQKKGRLFGLNKSFDSPVVFQPYFNSELFYTKMVYMEIYTHIYIYIIYRERKRGRTITFSI